MRFPNAVGRKAKLRGRPSLIAIAATAAPLPPSDYAPSCFSPATISGTVQELQTLTRNPGVWVGHPVPTVTWQWTLDGADVAGETGDTFALPSGSAGKVVGGYEKANNGIGGNVTQAATGGGSIAPYIVLGDLSFDTTTLIIGTPTNGTIVGATPGSTISSSDLPVGVTIDSAARTWSYDGSAGPSSGSFTLTETLAGASNSPHSTLLSYVEKSTLNDLILTGGVNNLVAGVAASGNITNTTPGSVITATGLPAGFTIDSAARTWAYDGSGAAASGTFTLTETLGTAVNSPHDTVIAYTKAPTLQTLSFSGAGSDLVVGTPANGTINNATAGSVITATGLPAGLTINSAARTWAWDGTGTAGSGTFTLIETLAGAVGNPSNSVIGYTIVPSASTLSAPAIAFDVAGGWTPGQNPPAIAISLPSDGSIQIGDWYRYEVANNAGFTGSQFSAWHKITSEDYLNGTDGSGFIFTWGSELPSSGATYFRAQFGRGASAGAISLTSAVSNVINDTLAGASSTITLTQGPGGTGTTDKTKYIQVNAPALQFGCAAVGSTLLVRSNKAASADKFHIELSCDGQKSSSSGHFFGLDERVLDCNNAGGGTTSAANYPGNTVNNGLFCTVTKGSTTMTVYRNGGSQNVTIPAWTLGDRLAFDVDRTHLNADGVTLNPTVAISHIRGTTVTPAVTITMTSKIPASWWILAGGKFGGSTYPLDTVNDCGSLKPNTSDWAMVPPSGFGIAA